MQHLTDCWCHSLLSQKISYHSTNTENKHNLTCLFLLTFVIVTYSCLLHKRSMIMYCEARTLSQCPLTVSHYTERCFSASDLNGVDTIIETPVCITPHESRICYRTVVLDSISFSLIDQINWQLSVYSLQTPSEVQ